MEALGPSNVRIWSSRVVVQNAAAEKSLGVSQNDPEKLEHNSSGRPQREKRMRFGAGEGKKRAGGPAEGGSRRGWGSTATGLARTGVVQSRTSHEPLQANLAQSGFASSGIDHKGIVQKNTIIIAMFFEKKKKQLPSR